MTTSDLATVIAEATRLAFGELFATVNEDFYYCTLWTSGEALPPAPSAWSHQALDRASAGDPGSRELLEWSPCDSPYDLFGLEHFEQVTQAFSQRPQPRHLDAAGADQEVAFRMSAMVQAMQLLDAEGLFGTGTQRAGVMVMVEVLPPDSSNAERARLLNPDGPLLTRWLNEVGEGE